MQMGRNDVHKGSNEIFLIESLNSLFLGKPNPAIIDLTKKI